MERRNLILIPRISLPFFLAGTAAVKKAPKRPEFAFIGFPETFEGAGGKDSGPPDFADWPDDENASKKSPSGDSEGERKNLEGKGSQR